MRWDYRIEYDIHGATLWVGEERLTSACMGDGEVDHEIAMLKKDLDAMAKKMKTKIRAERKKPLELEVSDQSSDIGGKE